jgi:hypothetical protein
VIAMIPLISASLYDRLTRARHEMSIAGLQDVASVFVPIGADPATLSPARLLFVGQATRGWGEVPLDYEAAADKSWKVMEELLIQPGRAVFWQDIRWITAQVLRMNGETDTDQAMLQAVGWSNLLKIGRTNRNATSDFAPAQRHLCIECLRAEVDEMQPDATILMSGTFHKDIVLDTFGPDSWRQNSKSSDRVSVKEHSAMGTILWTDHPRSLRKDGMEDEVFAFVAGYVAALVGR